MSTRFVCKRAAAVASIVVALTAGGLASATASPFAVQKSGSLSCGGGAKVALYAYYSGVGRFYAPTATLRYTADHGSVIYESTYNTGNASVSWKITVTGGYLDDSRSGAYCAGS